LPPFRETVTQMLEDLAQENEQTSK
jgi:hypothetical protein